MPKVTIDGTVVEVPAGSSVLQACELAGKEIPRFCYHDRLSVAGNCRMCLVEVEKNPKPVASCAFPVADGMVVWTDSPMVRRGRRGALEFLLINHPLDCPICDQGGECDLQDESMAYGLDRSRFREQKRAVRDKYFGPLIKTVMTRCIHCTRCIRFAQEIAGVPELGATGRGENMEVTNYIERMLTSELSGNIIDLCPVGALTSKPYAFVARSWELVKTDSIDVLDAVGCNIRIDSRGPEVLRIVPRLHEDVNEEWLGDKSRFALDGLRRRRLDRPWVKRGGKLEEASWQEAFTAIADRLGRLNGARIGAVAGDLADAESMLALKHLMQQLGSNNLDCRQLGEKFDASRRDFYLFNTTIAGIEDADALLLIGTNPRREAPVLNARIRKRWLAGNFPVAAIGEPAELTYAVEWLGNSPQVLAQLLAEAHPFLKRLQAAERPMLILGQGALARADGAAMLAAAWELARKAGLLRPEWHGFNVLHAAAARVGALDLGFLPGEGGKSLDAMLDDGVDALWLLGADEFPIERIGPRTFVIYQGHHGDRGASRADVILPGAAYTEKHGTYVNTEGRVQRGALAVYPPGDAREDWKILRAFSAVMGKPLPYDDLESLRAKLEAENPIFGRIDECPRRGCADLSGPKGDAQALTDAPFVSPISDYYRTDPISRASPTMALCQEALRANMPIAAE
ncbi:MAG: NADH-quinone oxidoreductase subunit NuoG [Acidobacteriia bacterium]|nr:NADH-quinone oxidoreductase subunit G [Methyloceanibacter sp.]MBX5471140.1 NADH-quinone oxidoreductase subunit G [Acetobacteraceae bacterium]MCL6491818.1 NADH-quinone oxidoreductase subunit NuoG [Terriglobia bacterium]